MSVAPDKVRRPIASRVRRCISTYLPEKFPWSPFSPNSMPSLLLHSIPFAVIRVGIKRVTKLQRSQRVIWKQVMFPRCFKQGMHRKSMCTSKVSIPCCCSIHFWWSFLECRHEQGRHYLSSIDRWDCSGHRWRCTEVVVCVRATEKSGSLYRECCGQVSVCFSDGIHDI